MMNPSTRTDSKATPNRISVTTPAHSPSMMTHQFRGWEVSRGWRTALHRWPTCPHFSLTSWRIGCPSRDHLTPIRPNYLFQVHRVRPGQPLSGMCRPEGWPKVLVPLRLAPKWSCGRNRNRLRGPVSLKGVNAASAAWSGQGPQIVCGTGNSLTGAVEGGYVDWVGRSVPSGLLPGPVAVHERSRGVSAARPDGVADPPPPTPPPSMLLPAARSCPACWM
jgi:hypothetical protein